MTESRPWEIGDTIINKRGHRMLILIPEVLKKQKAFEEDGWKLEDPAKTETKRSK